MKMNHTQQQSRAGPRTNGFTIVELLVVMAIIGIVGSLALYGLRGLSPRAVDVAGQLGGTVKQVRAKAMATTSAYRLLYVSENELRAEWARSCNAAAADWTVDARMGLELPDQFAISQNDGSAYATNDEILCFSPRGLSNVNPTVLVTDTQRGNSASVEVLIGGAVEVQ